MINAIIWGLLQGLTEFLPISSSGHLVLVPALMGLEPPSLATSALLHLGTLAAVVAFFRRDLIGLLAFRTDHQARRTLVLLAVGSVPVALGIFVRDFVETLQDSTRAVSTALIVTGIILAISTRFPLGARHLTALRIPDAVVIGVAQAIALIPGISRSGITITAGIARSMDRAEAARFSFLLGVPAIAGAGLLEMAELLTSSEGIPNSVWVGMGVAAVSGYAAIALLLRMLAKRGLAVFALYTTIAGIVGLIAL